MMSIKERFIHVFLFQITAGLFSLILALYLVDRNVMLTMSALVVGAIVATSWNWIFNYVFDRILADQREKRSVLNRIIHACLFECGILIFITPVYSFCLGISIKEGLVLNTSVVVYFLIYTYIFNMLYDKVKYYLKEKLNGNRIDIPVFLR